MVVMVVVVVMVDLESVSSFKQILVMLLLVINNTSIRDAPTHNFRSFFNIVQKGFENCRICKGLTDALVKA